MTIWLLAIVLLASLAGLGYRQGAIRVAFSLVGILFAALVAVPLGIPVTKLLGILGVSNPVLAWALGPIVAFIIISSLFKAGAAVVHHKVDVYFKYKAGDLRLALWDRLNRRLGLCLGLVNGAAYLALISFLIYVCGYWTVQLETSETDPRSLRYVSRMARDLDSTGFNKVARAVGSMPAYYYQAADVAGLLYQNSLLEARLARYPAFLGLAERPEFQALATDKELTERRLRQEPIMNILNQGSVQGLVQDPAMLKLIWATVLPELSDLQTYFTTGKSPKYDPEKILGRWYFDINAAISAVRRAKPNIPASEMKKYRAWMTGAFSKTSMVALTDNQVVLKDMPQIKLGPAGGSQAGQTMQGQWKNAGNKYELSFPNVELAATIANDRMTIKSEGLDLIFTHED